MSSLQRRLHAAVTLAVCLGLSGVAGAQTKLELKDGSAKVNSVLTAKDAKDTVRPNPSKVFTVELQAGQAYQIDMIRLGKKSQIDPYLRLEDSKNKQLAQDDDSGGFPNARIIFNCTENGTYRIICTSFAGTTGAFTLSVKTTDAKAVVQPPKVGVPLKVAADLKLNNGMIEINSKVDNTDGNDTVLKLSFAKLYTIKMEAKKRYQIDMASKTLDSYLRLEDATGKELAKDDDSGGGLNARIVFTCPAGGNYRIYATTLFPAMGDFTLTVKELP